MMTSKERLLCALEGGKPDRMPASVHQWQPYHLEKYLGGIDALEACRRFNMDAQIQYFQDMGQFWLVGQDWAQFSTPYWRDTGNTIDDDPDHCVVHHTIETPEGTLTYHTESDRKTTWVTKYLIERDEDIELIRKYMPVPALDVKPIEAVYDEIGDQGILRGFVWGDQVGCWQHACCLMDVNQLIMCCFEKPDWVHRLMNILLEKKLQFIESMKGAKFDLVETGGGAASSTLISPALHEKFCLPYDRKLHDAVHEMGFRITYHICGGNLGIEEMIVTNGCDACETLPPTSVGGNQEPWDFRAKVGNRISLIGGVDQHNVVTEGTDERIRDTVHRLFETVGRDGGYICSLSDHFFETPPKKLRVYADAARECVY
jgi:uroporphyrinogen-III decarboxylase